MELEVVTGSAICPEHEIELLYDEIEGETYTFCPLCRISALSEDLETVQAKIREYETWFRSNAAMLATHRIGGYCFEPLRHSIKVDPVHGTIIAEPPTGNGDRNG